MVIRARRHPLANQICVFVNGVEERRACAVDVEAGVFERFVKADNDPDSKRIKVEHRHLVTEFVRGPFEVRYRNGDLLAKVD